MANITFLFKLYIGIGFLDKFYDNDLNFLYIQTATLNAQELQQVM